MNDKHYKMIETLLKELTIKEADAVATMLIEGGINRVETDNKQKETTG